MESAWRGMGLIRSCSVAGQVQTPPGLEKAEEMEWAS